MTDAENNLPRDLQHPGGFVEDAMDWINATAVCPQLIFALASALCLVGDLVRAVKETVAENNDEKAKKRILQIVAESKGGITRNDLTRRTQFIRKSFRDEYLDDLVEAGELVVKFGANGGEVYFPGN